MGIRGPLSSAERDFVVSMYVRGHLATLDEGALVAGVTKFTVRRWLIAAGIDWRARRLHFLGKCRARSIAAGEGRTVRRPSKREMRRLAAKLKQDWDKAHASELEEQGASDSGR
jgi:hypothetical protein